MKEKNLTHVRMLERLIKGLESARRVADATGTHLELKPMVRGAYTSLLECDYRDEEDFQDARFKAGDIVEGLSFDGYAEWVRRDTNDLIRDLHRIRDSFTD